MHQSNELHESQAVPPNRCHALEPDVGGEGERHHPRRGGQRGGPFWRAELRRPRAPWRRDHKRGKGRNVREATWHRVVVVRQILQLARLRASGRGMLAVKNTGPRQRGGVSGVRGEGRRGDECCAARERASHQVALLDDLLALELPEDGGWAHTWRGGRGHSHHAPRRGARVCLLIGSERRLEHTAWGGWLRVGAQVMGGVRVSAAGRREGSEVRATCVARLRKLS